VLIAIRAVALGSRLHLRRIIRTRTLVRLDAAKLSICAGTSEHVQALLVREAVQLHIKEAEAHLIRNGDGARVISSKERLLECQLLCVIHGLHESVKSVQTRGARF